MNTETEMKGTGTRIKDPEEQRRLTVCISGRVQGVGFRFFVRKVVSSLSVEGFIRNDGDGTVTLVAEGSEDDLQKLLKAVEKGPDAADVEEVDVNWSTAFGQFDGFHVRLW